MTLLEQLILNEHLAKQIVQIGLIILYKITEIINDTIPSYRLE